MAELAHITRRGILKGIAAGSAVTVPSVALSTMAERHLPISDEGMLARDRVDWLLAELKVAVLEANPKVRVGDIFVNLDDEGSSVPLMIIFQWATGKYEGDGIYAGGGSEYSELSRYEVKALDEPIRGERGYSVIEVGEKDRKKRMRLNESRFESFIGVRVGPPGEGA